MSEVVSMVLGVPQVHQYVINVDKNVLVHDRFKNLVREV